MKEAITKKNMACKKLCVNKRAENRLQHIFKNQMKKVIARDMRYKLDQVLKELNRKPNNIFKLVKFMKKDGKDIEGESCMRGKVEGWVSVKKTKGKYGERPWR